MSKIVHWMREPENRVGYTLCGWSVQKVSCTTIADKVTCKRCDSTIFKALVSEAYDHLNLGEPSLARRSLERALFGGAAI